jgi:tetratricopeptide (TPR) repeat protein
MPPRCARRGSGCQSCACVRRRASFSLSLRLLSEEETNFFACLSVCAPDGFSVRAAAAAAGCEEDVTHEPLGLLYRLSLLNRPQAGEGRFVFHPLLRLFAQELAAERSLLDVAAERHARYFIRLVKTCNVNVKSDTSALVAELDDITLASEWLRVHEEADYAFVIRLEPFLMDHGYWQRALELIEWILGLAEHAGDFDVEVRFRLKQAKYLSLRGEWALAQDVLKIVPNLLKKIEVERHKTLLEVMWLNTLGGIQQRLGRFNEAIDTLRLGAAIEEKLGDRRGQAKILTSLAAVLQRQGKLDEAVDVLRQCETIEELLGNRRGHAMVLTSLGSILQRLGRFDEATDVLQRGAAIEEKRNNHRGLAMVLNSLGWVLLRTGRAEEAADVFRRSVKIGEVLRDRRHTAMALNSLGGALQRLRHFEEALSAFRRSYDVAEELNDLVSLSMRLNSMGRLLVCMGRNDEAISAFQRSIEIGERLGDKFNLSIAHSGLGAALLARGDVGTALNEFRASFQINEEIRNVRGLCTVTPELARLLSKRGKHEEASEFCRRALVVAPKDRQLLALHKRFSAPRVTRREAPVIQGEVEKVIRNERGYRFGFIKPDGGGQKVYFSDGIVASEYMDKMAQGVRVELEVEQGAKGPRATRVRILNGE